MAPIKTFQTRNQYASWLSEETKTMMVERDNAVKRFSETKNAADWEEARIWRNKVNRRLRTEKMRCMKEKISNYEK